MKAKEVDIFALLAKREKYFVETAPESQDTCITTEDAIDFACEYAQLMIASQKPSDHIPDAGQMAPTAKGERFKMPTDKQLVDIAILFNQENGNVDQSQMTDMVAMSMFILDRLQENNDVSIPSSKEDVEDRESSINNNCPWCDKSAPRRNQFCEKHWAQVEKIDPL